MLVRPARPDDVGTLVRFIHELAEFEREPEAVQVTEDGLRSLLFADRPHVWAHVAQQEDELVGMALWFVNFSTWEGTHGIYLEDLYVSPDARGLGVGTALLKELGAICVERRYARLELSVLDWNTPAIAFYRSLGAVGMEDWTVQRISGRALAALAE